MNHKTTSYRAFFVAVLSAALLVYVRGLDAQSVGADTPADEFGYIGRSSVPRIRVGLPVPRPVGDELRLQPWVEVADSCAATEEIVDLEPGEYIAADHGSHRLPALDSDSQSWTPIGELADPAIVSSDVLIEGGAVVPGGSTAEPLPPIFNELTEPPKQRVARIKEWATQPLSAFPGVGYQRLSLALFEMDTAVPNKALRFRFASAYDHEFPDRAEYFWAKAPDGIGLSSPFVETAVDYQEFRIQMETGGERASVITELPIRSLDPEFNSNTTGLGDMSIAAKTVLKQGDCWTLSQIFRTYLKTGAVTHGLSSGHVSLEPGLLFTKRHGRRLQLHSELKYWFPIAGDPDHSGQILRYGLGVSSIFRESDCFAIIPTLEVVGFTVLDGRKTGANAFGLPDVVEVDGESIVNLYPGIWFVRERKSPIEFGLSSGLSITNERFFRSLLRADLRIAF